MNKPADVFKNTFIYSLLAILTFSLTLRLIPLFVAMFKFENIGYTNLALWGLTTIHSSLLLGVFALIIPWLMLSFYGEFFYTRSLNRNNIFEIFRNEHIKYLGISILAIYIVTFAYNNFPENYEEKFGLSSLSYPILSSLIITLIISGNSGTLKKILLYGLPVFIVTPMIISGRLNVLGIDISYFWLLWLPYLTVIYKIVSTYDDDIDLNVPGKADDENKAISNSWFFSKEFGNKKADINKNKLFPKFRMLTAYTNNVYVQLFLVMISIYFFFAPKIDYDYGDIDLYRMTTLSLVFIAAMIFSNPKFIILQGEEFLATRALSRGKIYLYNYLYQGLLISLLALVTFILPILFYVNDFNIVNILLLALWMYLGGELSIILFLFLFICDFTFMNLYWDINSNLTISLVVNILSHTFNSLFIWLSVILFRVCDYLWFAHKEIGFIKEWKQMFIGLSKLYIPTFVIAASVSIFAAYNNPFTKFLNQQRNYFNEFSRYNVDDLNDDVLKTLFFKIEKADKSVISILKDDSHDLYLYKNISLVYQNIYSDMIKNPYDQKNYLKLSRAYVDEINFYFNSSNYYGYSYNNLIDNTEYILNHSSSFSNTTDYYYQMSVLKNVQNKSQESIEWAKKATKNNEPEYLINLAKLYNFEMLNKESIATYQNIYKMGNPNYKVLRKIGEIYWNNRNYTEAIDYYARAVSFENEQFQLKHYYYLGLCNQLKDLKNKDYYNKNINLAKDLESYLDFCSNRNKITEYKTYVRKIRDDSLYIGFRSFKLDYIKRAEEMNDLEEAEKKLKKYAYSYSSDADGSGRLALLQLQLGKKEEAKQTINRYNASDIVYGIGYDLNQTRYSSDLYKAMILTGDYGDKAELAKNMIVSANDTDKVWNDLKNLLDKKSLDQLESFKNLYKNMYIEFENKGLSLISNNKSVERTKKLIKKMDNSQREKYQMIINTTERIK